MTPCHCPESSYLVDTMRVPAYGHDCAYVAARESLIPIAARLANAHVRQHFPGTIEPDRHASWTPTFMAEMDRLWGELRRAGA